jgi:hypothetical protein
MPLWGASSQKRKNKMTTFYRPRLQQIFKFETFSANVIDVDVATDMHGDVFIFGDFKSKKAELSNGQSYFFKALVENLGQTKPTFFFVAHHDTDVREDVEAADLRVTSCFYRWPGMPCMSLEVYDRDEELPTFNNMLTAISMIYGKSEITRDRPDPYEFWMYDPVMAEAYDSDFARELRRKREVGYWITEKRRAKDPAFREVCEEMIVETQGLPYNKFWSSRDEKRVFLEGQVAEISREKVCVLNLSSGANENSFV